LKSHWTVSLYTTTTTTTTCRLHHRKILFIYINRRPRYCCLCKNPRSRPQSSWILFVQYFGISVRRTSNVIHIPNFVQICAIVNELWKINKIQNGGRRHLESTIFVHFGQMVYFRWQPATSLQNFIHICQSAAEILLFVQKSKMPAAAILNLIFVQYFGIPAWRTSSVIRMPNFVQICKIFNELWKINEI